MKAAKLDLLRHEVEQSFGRKILTSSDCKYLSDVIYEKTRYRISFNTLRRCFNLMKADNKPSLYTLDILSMYCGYTSFSNFLTYRSEKDSENSEDYNHGLLNYLILLFRDTEVVNGNDITYFSLVQHTIIHLEKHQNIVDNFQREIARTKNGQNYYFEQFINIDKLNFYYGDGLRYYLHEKRSPEAQLLGHSLLCFRSWLTMDDSDVDKHLNFILHFEIDHTIDPSVSARYFATKLYYSYLLNISQNSVCISARLFYESITSNTSIYSSYYCFEIVMAEALILMKFYEEALFYLDQLLLKIQNAIPSYVDIPLMETINLFKGIAYSQTGRKAKAREILQNIKPEKFHFLSKKYLTILLLSLKRISKSRFTELEQLKYLVEDTRFTRLISFWESFYHLEPTVK